MQKPRKYDLTVFGLGRPNIERLRRRGDLAGLLAALDHRHESVAFDGVVSDADAPLRVGALRALSEFFGPQVADGVLAGLKDPYPSVRLAAVEAAARAGARQTSVALIRGIVLWETPTDGEAIAKALEALVSWRMEHLTESFAMTLLDHPTVALEERHRAALSAMMAGDPRGPEESASATAAEIIDRLCNAAINDTFRARASQILSWLGDAGVTEVVRFLREADPEPVLLRAAGDLRDNRALDAVLSACGHPIPTVRTGAAVALGQILDSHAVPTLLALTQDRDHGVRESASRALDAFGVTAVVLGLGTARLSAFGDHDPRESVRGWLAGGA